MIKRERLDQALVSRGLAPSRHKAQALILGGRVLVNGQKICEADHPVGPGTEIELPEKPETRYVSRGGLKLEEALRCFNIKPAGKIAMDVGASTGGFTDCLLKHGARLVYAVDVGKSQMDGKLRSDRRVHLIQNMNARYLKPDLFDPKPALAVIDVSFISVKKVLPALLPCLAQPFEMLVLVKPQFECKRGEAKKGIVKDQAVRERVLEEIKAFCEKELRLCIAGAIPSAITGAKGNQEFFLFLGPLY